MKKLLLALLLTCVAKTFAQDAAAAMPKNEVKWNIANTIAFASVEVGYEYFIDGHQSVGAEVLINDVFNFSIGREVKDFDTSSFQLTYNYYTSALGNASGFVVSPML